MAASLVEPVEIPGLVALVARKDPLYPRAT
jgi:hypothetical protein